jgi:hypothetical protein
MIRMPRVWLALAHYFGLDERQTRGWWLALMHSTWTEPSTILATRPQTPPHWKPG